MPRAAAWAVILACARPFIGPLVVAASASVVITVPRHDQEPSASASSSDEGTSVGPVGEASPIVSIGLPWKYELTIRHRLSSFPRPVMSFMAPNFDFETSIMRVFLSIDTPTRRIGKVIERFAEGSSRRHLSKFATFESILVASDDIGTMLTAACVNESLYAA